jgi:hypothetical protein
MYDTFRSFPTCALTFVKFCYMIQIVNVGSMDGRHVKCDILKAHSVYLPIHEDGRMKTRYDKIYFDVKDCNLFQSVSNIKT